MAPGVAGITGCALITVEAGLDKHGPEGRLTITL